MIDKINGNGVQYPDSRKKKNPAVRAYENTPGTKEAAQKKAGGVSKSSRAAAADRESGVILDLSAKTAKEKGRPAARKSQSSWTDALRKLLAPVLQWVKAFWESDSPKNDKNPAAQSQDVQGPQDMSGASEDMAQISDMEQNGQASDAAGQLAKGAADAAGMLASDAAALDEDMLPPLDELQEGHTAKLPGLDELQRITGIKGIGRGTLRPGNIEKIEQFVTRNGTKHLAHNSGLLTYYDRQGKIVELDESQKHRVLFGDKDVLKL